MRNILKVELGRHEMDTWYFSPFPPGACCWGFPKSDTLFGPITTTVYSGHVTKD